MNRFIVYLFILAALIAPVRFSHAEVVDKVVAVVNEDPITLYELDLAMARSLEMIRRAPTQMQQEQNFNDTKTLALKMLIDDKLLEQEMKKFNIAVTQADEQKALDNILQRNNMSLSQLKKEIRSKGQSWDVYQTSVKEQIKRIKFMGQIIAPKVKVTDADLDEFFAKNPEKFARFQSVEMAQIIVPLAVNADEATVINAQKQAEAAYTSAKKGANFEQLGKKYSVNAATAVKETYPVAQLAPQIALVLSDLKRGEVSEPVRSTMGLHIIKLYDRKTLAGEEYQAIREQLRERVFEYKVEQETQKYLDDMKSRSFIEVKA